MSYSPSCSVLKKTYIVIAMSSNLISVHADVTVLSGWNVKLETWLNLTCGVVRKNILARKQARLSTLSISFRGHENHCAFHWWLPLHNTTYVRSVWSIRIDREHSAFFAQLTVAFFLSWLTWLFWTWNHTLIDGDNLHQHHHKLKTMAWQRHHNRMNVDMCHHWSRPLSSQISECFPQVQDSPLWCFGISEHHPQIWAFDDEPGMRN